MAHQAREEVDQELLDHQQLEALPYGFVLIYEANVTCVLLTLVEHLKAYVVINTFNGSILELYSKIVLKLIIKSFCATFKMFMIEFSCLQSLDNRFCFINFFNSVNFYVILKKF